MNRNPLLPSRSQFIKFLLATALNANIVSPVQVRAQKTQKESQLNLADFAGTYQLVNNNKLHLSIRPSKDQLILKQHWDNREIAFNAISGLSFLNTDLKFPLDFKRDGAGKISQVTAFQKDVWLRTITMETPASKLSAKQIKAAFAPLIKDFCNAINANSASATEQFLKQYFTEDAQKSLPLRQVTQQANNLYRSTGGIEFVPGSLDTDNQTIVCKGKTFGNTYAFTFKLNDSGKIAAYSFREIPGFAESAKPSNEGQLIKTLREKLADLSQKDIFSGTVLVAKGNTVLFEYACGEANKISHQNNNIHTKFNLGSMNKMFTATSIMKLVEENKVSLQDPLGKFLDESWLQPDLASKITIHHLLSHTSGVGDFFGKEFAKAPRSQFTPLEGYKPFIIKNKLLFEPGTSWSYSNAGMILLGAVIEKVSGRKYSDYVSENIYKPAGMTNTGFFDASIDKDNIAIGYIPQTEGSYKNNLNNNATIGSSAGGGYSNVQDLFAFSKALKSGKLVSANSLQLMFKDHAGREYGYGFQLNSSPAGSTIGHSGGAPGVNSTMKYIPGKDFTVIVMSNYDHGTDPLANHILYLLQDL